jgi:hypothetical protein
LRIWRREVVDETSRVRQICPEQIWTAAGWPRSALARRGEAHGWAEQSLPPRDSAFQRRQRLFAYLAERGGGRILPGSTNFPGANLDSRRLALEREARKGEAHGWAEQSLPPRDRALQRRQALFAYLAESALWMPPRVRQICLELVGQSQTGPGARSAKG